MGSIAETLGGAADHLEKLGWQKGQMFETLPGPVEELRCCALGALAVSSGEFNGANGLNWWTPYWESSNYKDAVEFLTEYLQVASVADWNDQQHEKQHVIDAIRQAADVAKERGL